MANSLPFALRFRLAPDSGARETWDDYLHRYEEWVRAAGNPQSVENLYTNRDLIQDVYIWETSKKSNPHLLRFDAVDGKIERTEPPANLLPLLGRLENKSTSLRFALRASRPEAYNVVFTPGSAAAFSRTLTVSYTGATVTGSPVTLTGTGVLNRATVSISPNPLTIVLSSVQFSGTGTLTLTNTAPAGGAQVAVTNVNISGGSLIDHFFNAVNGQDNCTGEVLAPGGSCTVGVRFTNVLATRNGSNRAGTIRFTDNASGSPQSRQLFGQAH